MPREIIHWVVLERAAARAAAECPAITEVLAQRREAAALGALLHDVPYYFRMGNDPIEGVADWFHGKHGEDTLAPMRTIASAILELPLAERGLLWPFFLGMLSHIAADVIFHPAVFYFTGNYHDRDPIERRRAQGRHRLFEVYLDAWGRVLYTNRPLRISGLIRRLRSAGLPKYCALLEAHFVPEKLFGEENRTGVNRWYRGVHTLGTFQAVFLSSIAGAIVRAINVVSRDRFFPEDALFSFGRFGYRSYFEAPLHYKLPMTGEPQQRSGPELLEDAVRETVELFKLFEPFVAAQQSDVDRLIGGVYGKSLNMGTARAISEDASHFSLEGAPLPGLVRTALRSSP